MYTIGSLADLISGSNTPNKATVKLTKIATTPKKVEKGSEIESPKVKTSKVSKKGNKPIQNASEATNTSPNTSLKRRAERAEYFTKAKKQKQEKKERAPEDLSKTERTIFVGNVPISSKIETLQNELKQFFSNYGTIETLRFRGIPTANPKIPKKVALLTKEFHPKRQTFLCYVVFSTAEEAKNALKANGLEFKGNHLRVDLTINAESDHDQKKAIFIGNLPFDVEEENVRNLFQECGEIISIRLIRDRITSMGKGFGYVNFDSSDSVELALQLEDVKLGNREIRIQRATKKQPNPNKRTDDGKKKRKVPRIPKPTKERAEDLNSENIISEDTTHFDKDESKGEFQGVKFTDKKKKKKLNKEEKKKKKMSKLLAPKPDAEVK